MRNVLNTIRSPFGDHCGAIFASGVSTTTVTASSFTGNSAGYGGAIEARGTRVIVNESDFGANEATLGDGGAIWVLEGFLDVDSSTFIDNEAQTTGGALLRNMGTRRKKLHDCANSQ